MRKLLNTLFVTTEDSYLALENENIVVWCGEKKIGQYPLSILEGILCFSYKGASPALMGACADRGIMLSFLTPRGRFLAQSFGENRGNVLLRKRQYRISDQEKDSCLIARSMIFGKAYNCRWCLERIKRDYELRVNTELMRQHSQQIQGLLARILDCTELDTLRGLEGDASVSYFACMDEMILNQKEEFFFHSRNRRPPLDKVNAMMSFVYTLLASDCRAALSSVGLDPYVGFLHRDRPGRASLALDLMEELRAPIADRVVLKLINKQIIQPKHFITQANGAVLLNDQGRKVVLTEWQNRKREEITHPYLKEKMYWGLVPYVQALLLARYIREDLDGYAPFLWK